MERKKQEIRLVIGVIIVFGLVLVIIGNILVQNRRKEKISEGIERVSLLEPKKEKRVEIEHKIVLLQEAPKIKKVTPVSIPEISEKDKEIEALIKKLKDRDFQTSQEAADKLARLGKLAVPFLLEALSDASLGLKGQIVFILGRIGDKQATPVLMELLKDENAYIRRNAAEALGKIKDERAIFSLTTGLFDEDGGVRERSAWALGELGDTRAVDDLINRMMDEKEERVKSAVVNAFGKIEDQRATYVLINELSSKSDQLYKNEVVVALGDIGDPMALSELTAYLNELKKYKEKPIEKKDELAELTEKMLDFQLEQAIKIAEEAIQKIQSKQ